MAPRARSRSRPASGSSSAARRASRPTCSRSSARRPSCGTTSSPPASTRSASSPAAASAGSLAHWIVDGRPDVDVTGMQHRPPAHATRPTRSTARTRTVESLGMVYQCHYPTRSMQTARGAKTSPFHDRLAAQRRVLPGRQRLGGRRLVRPRRASTPDRRARCRGAGQNWFPLLGGRAPGRARGRDRRWTCRSCRSSSCRAATPGRVLDHISANDVDGDAGPITYTQWLNEGGTLEADLTVTKLDDERFWVVASDTAHRHVETWMRRHIARRARVRHRRDRRATRSSTCRARARASCCSR